MNPNGGRVLGVRSYGRSALSLALVVVLVSVIVGGVTFLRWLVPG